MSLCKEQFENEFENIFNESAPTTVMSQIIWNESQIITQQVHQIFGLPIWKHICAPASHLQSWFLKEVMRP